MNHRYPIDATRLAIRQLRLISKQTNLRVTCRRAWSPVPSLNNAWCAAIGNTAVSSLTRRQSLVMLATHVTKRLASTEASLPP
jgi:hypothetical protein